MNKRWVLYVAFDLENCEILYIGITSNIRQRYSQHKADQESTLFQSGKQWDFIPIAGYDDIEYARYAESILIATIPGLMNKDKHHKASWLKKKMAEIPIITTGSAHKRGRPKKAATMTAAERVRKHRANLES